MKEKDKIKWKNDPDDHNYPAAESYLSLIYEPHEVEKIVKDLDHAIMSSFKAKDIFRASKLSLLGVSNSHVEKNLKKIAEEEKLSPILLVRDVKHRTVIVADGYHRMCAVYHYDEDAEIPCKIVTGL